MITYIKTFFFNRKQIHPIGLRYGFLYSWLLCLLVLLTWFGSAVAITAGPSINQNSYSDYVPGGPVYMTCIIDNFQDLSALGLKVELPDGWSYELQSMTGPDLPDNDKIVENGVEFFWTQLLDKGPIEFHYMLKSSSEVSGNQKIQADLLYRVNDGDQEISPAAPVTVQEATINAFHHLSDFIDENTCTVENSIFYLGDLTALGIRLSIPENTLFSESENATYQIKYINETTVEMFWNTPPSSPVEFSYLLTRNGATSENAVIESNLFYRIGNGVEAEKNIYPKSLDFPPGNQFKIHSTTSDENGGKIYPEGIIDISRGQSITFTQSTADGYSFVGWLVDGAIDHNAPFTQYRFVNVIDDHFIKAIFKRIEYQITIIKGANGTITSTTGDNKVFHGEDIDFLIIPDNGYEIESVRVNGSDYTLDGDNVVEFDNVTDNQQRLTVTFRPKKYEIILDIGDNGKVTTQDDHNFVIHGEDKTFIITPDNGYVIEEVKVNNQIVILTENKYTFRNVVQTGNTLEVSFALPETYVIKTEIEGDGKITPQGDISIEHGQDITFKFIPGANSIIKDVLIDGDISFGPLEEYRFVHVTDDHTITAKFVEKEQFLITATAGPGGAIEPLEVSVYQGEKQRFTIQPSEGYRIQDVIVDGESKGAVNSYTFWNVQENHEIEAYFDKIDQIFTVTVEYSEGGTVDPSGNIEVIQGDSLIIKTSPNFGYGVENVRINDEPIGALSKIVLDEVTENMVVYVQFKLIAEKPKALFSFDPGSGISPLKVFFTDHSEGYIENWLWVFGDGGQSANKSPIHTYSNPGAYTASLTVTGPGGTDTKTYESCIQVNDIQPVKVSFIATTTRGVAPLDVQFYNLTQGDVSNWLWDFGDGTESTEKNPTHVYTRTGNYSVTLTADNIYPLTKQDYIKISGRTIHGRVLAGDVDGNDTGNGLSGYIIEAHIRLNTILMPLFVSSTLTDENGNYTLIELPLTDNLIISAWPPFDDTQYMGEYYKDKFNPLMANQLSTKTANLTGINFVLKKTPALGIHGQVLNDDIGQPNIEVHAFSISSFFYQTTLTDNEGYYTFTNLINASDYRIYIWSESQQTELYYHLPNDQQVGVDLPTFSVVTWGLARKITPKDPIVNNINIIIDAEVTKIGSIQGVVRLKEDGKPVEGLWINAWSDTLKTGNGARTDSSGKYVIEGLLIPDSNDSDDGYIIEIDSSNDIYPYQAYNQVDDRSLAQKVLPGIENINFFLKTGNTIYGNVSDIEGIPLSNVTIQTWSLSQKTNNSATTNDFGVYSIPNLPPADDYVVAAFSEKYPVQYFFHKNKRINADHVDLTEGNVYNIDFQLDEGAVIEGNIFFLDNIGSKEPAGAGIFVNVWSQTSGRLYTEKTDENSHYRFVGLDPNMSDYIIYVWEEDYLRAYYSKEAEHTTVHRLSDATQVQPETILTSQSHDLVLFSGFEIRGKITYNSVPVSNVKIEAWDETNEILVDDVSIGNISQGYNYRLTGLIGNSTYEVRIYHDKFVDDVQSVQIIDDNVTNVNFYLQPYARSISGTISGLSQGDILFVKAGQKKSTILKMVSVVGTGNDISYEISGLEPLNKYIVDIVPTYKYPYICYDAQTAVQKATLIDLSYTNATNINLNLFTETVSISGTIQFPGTASKNEFVTVYAYSKKLNAENQKMIIYTKENAVDYEISGLRPSDDYVVSIDSNLYKQQFFDNENSFDQATLIDTTDSIVDDNINFELSVGTYIEGIVYAENGKGKPNVRVEAWSDKLQNLGYATTLSDGYYRIGGLGKSDDYIVYISYKNSIFYYHQSSNVVSNIDNSTFVSTSLENPSGIDFHIIQTETISGIIRDSNNKSLENVMVSATSMSTGAGNGCKTDKKGYYIITNLPPGKDYQITVTPEANTNYIAQIETDVKSGSTNNNFILKKGFTLKGTIKSWQNNYVSNAVVEISSKDGIQQFKSVTDNDGYYEIKGIPEGKGYYLFITAPPQSSLVDSFEKGLLINQTFEKNIVLGPASRVDGHVTIYDPTGLNGLLPAANVMITLFSPELSFWTSVHTDTDGYYIIENIPDATDYIVKSISDNYINHIETERSSGETVNFSIEPANIIKGIVLNTQTGAGMDGAQIEIFYKTDIPIKIARADKNGRFKAASLNTTIKGETVKEYIVIASYNGYPDAEAVWKVGQSVLLELKMSRTDENVIKGTVADKNSNPPPDDVTIFVRVYNYQSRGGLIRTRKCDSDGSFRFEGLKLSGRYQLKIIAENSILQSPKLWLSNDGTGSTKRAGASIVQTSDGDISFKFSETWLAE